MLRKANNVFGVILSDVTIATSTLPSVGTAVTNDNLTAGAVVLVDAGNRRTTLSALAAGDKYHVVQGRGANSPLNKSAAIEKGTESISIQKHVPAQQQITVIGTAGLPAANDTSYYIKLRKNDNDEGNRSQPFSLFGQYKTGGSATQSEVAYGLAGNFITNMAREARGTNGYVLIEVRNAAAATNTAFGGLGNVTGNLTLVKGSKGVTMTDTQDLAAGDYFRVDSSATETLTAPVYKIASVDSATAITLETPYQGASVASLDDDFVHLIPAATGDAANFSIALTGVESKFDVNKFRNYFANRFTATFSDTDTVVTLIQGARNGSGVWQAVAMDEYMSYGFDGQNEMLAVPPTGRDAVVKVPGVASQTALTSKYSTINIKWKSAINGLVSAGNGDGNVIVHLNLEDSSGSGILDTVTANTGETLAAALGLTPGDLDE